MFITRQMVAGLVLSYASGQAGNGTQTGATSEHMARSWVLLARRCHCPQNALNIPSWTSSSGGGLPGRPVTRKSPDAC